MGDLLGSFLRERVSEDKARWKDSCWFVGTIIDLGCHTSHVKKIGKGLSKELAQ